MWALQIKLYEYSVIWLTLRQNMLANPSQVKLIQVYVWNFSIKTQNFDSPTYLVCIQHALHKDYTKIFPK